MKKSLRLLLGTIVLAITLAAASTSHSQLGAVGTDPVPMCPPGGCAIN